MLASMVILDELPFKFVESEGFHQFCRALNPKFVIPSRVTIPKDCFQMYMKEKKKLKSVLTRSGHRVCLTTTTTKIVVKLIEAVMESPSMTIRKNCRNKFFYDKK